MFTIFNGRQRQLDGDQPRIYAQLDVTIRAHIAEFKQQNSLNPFAVFIAIALHTNENGWGWPTTETLKKETGLTSDRTIYAIVAFLRDMKLEGKRVLDQYRIYEGGKWGASYYHIFPEAGGADKLPDRRLQLWGKKTHYHMKKQPEAPPVVVHQVDTTICRGTTYGSHAGLLKDNHSEGDQETISTDVDIVAENAKTHLSADTSKLSLEAQNLLKELETHRTISRSDPLFKHLAVEELLRAGLIDATFEGHTITAITAKQPQPLTGSKALPDHLSHVDEMVDPAVAQLTAELEHEFAPLSKGGGGEDKSPAPQSLQNMPEVPEVWPTAPGGLVLRYEEKMFSPHVLHYGNAPNKIATLCGIRSYKRSATEPHRIYTGRDWRNAKPSDYRLCPDCAAKAAQPRAAKRATKAAKSAIFSDARIFEAIGLFAFNAKDKAELKANGGRIGRIRNKLCQFVVDKLGHEPSPEEIDKLLKRLAGFGAWYDKACDGCSRPAGEDTFVSWWVKYVADKSGNGAGDKLPQGDFSEPVWIDRLFVKREGGKLYCRPQVGEWREAVPSEVEKWS